MDQVYSNTITAALESLLIIQFRPTFLALQFHETDGIIEIVMSCLDFAHLSIPDRTTAVFKEIEEHLPTVMQDHLIIAQLFDGAQIEAVLEDMFKK